MIEVLDKGYVDLIEHYGNDLTIVNAARVSFDKYSPEFTEKDAGLINYLMKNKHGTPFEMIDCTFRVKLPIFVAREWMRHRMASYNEMSGRYVELKKEMYVPKTEHVREQRGKPGNYYYEPTAVHTATIAQNIIETNNEKCWEQYQELLNMGIAKEQARLVLPLNIYTEFIFKANLRSLLNFIALRNHEHAMFEIKEYAVAIEELIKEIVPITIESFEKNGRNVP